MGEKNLWMFREPSWQAWMVHENEGEMRANILPYSVTQKQGRDRRFRRISLLSLNNFGGLEPHLNDFPSGPRESSSPKALRFFPSGRGEAEELPVARPRGRKGRSKRRK
jgi:hypothetical protein